MSQGTAATGPHVLRRINAAAVLRALRDMGEQPARVSDLVLATGLSRPAVSRAVSTLVAARLVESLGSAQAQVGRPATRVRFRAESGHVAGVDIGPHRMTVLVADLAGTVRAERRVATPPKVTGAWLVRSLRGTLAKVVADAKLAPSDLWAVAVGSPGIVDQERGEVRLAPSIPGWTGLPMLAELRNWLHCPVLVDNDVNLAVRAEQRLGSSADNLLYVHWGERIGSGIVIDGKPYRGASSAAGELGFLDLTTAVDEPPTPATDGLGSFERLVGARAILQHAIDTCDGPLREKLTATGDLAPLFDAAANGDQRALAVVHTVAARFARGLATQLLILDPGLVVIGGGLSRAGDVLIDAVRQFLRPQLLTPIEVRASTLGDNAVAVGAVCKALDAAEERIAMQL
ncbi:MAG: ROK family transcriptional regulator [Sciscionella sp.]|nr:ROK family transcriptional regulator [Sciscionella sp.]